MRMGARNGGSPEGAVGLLGPPELLLVVRQALHRPVGLGGCETSAGQGLKVVFGLAGRGSGVQEQPQIRPKAPALGQIITRLVGSLRTSRIQVEEH